MNPAHRSSAEFQKKEEIEASSTRYENDLAVMVYNPSLLNTMAAATTVTHQDIPLQHFGLTSARSRPIGLNLPVPRSIPSRRPTQSLASIGGARVQEMGMEHSWNEACLGAEGGYDPRETASGLNGLPRSKSVRHGIDQRFLRNEAVCNTRSGNIALPMLRHNTVACINNIPFLPSTHNFTNMGFSSIENNDQRLLRIETSSNSRSEDVALPMVRHNTMACIKDIPLLPSVRYNTNVGGHHSREDIEQRNNTRCSDIAIQMQKFNPASSISNIPLLASKQSNARVEGFNPKRKVKPRDSQTITQETGNCNGVDISFKVSESEIDIWEEGTTRNRCQGIFIFIMIAFIASLVGAALYSLIGCSMVGCKKGNIM